MYKFQKTICIKYQILINCFHLFVLVMYFKENISLQERKFCVQHKSWSFHSLL